MLEWVVLRFEVALDEFVTNEEYAVCETRTSQCNAEARVVGTEISNPRVLWEFRACDT